MKRFIMAGVVAGIMMTAAGGFGATMQDLIYQGATANDMAIFHGKGHLERGIKCAECHNKDVFPEKKFGAVKVTMKTQSVVFLTGDQALRTRLGQAQVKRMDCSNLEVTSSRPLSFSIASSPMFSTSPSGETLHAT